MMALLDVVFRALNKAGDAFIEQRREDGHGSASDNPTYVELNSTQTQTDALTDAELRASAIDVNTGLTQPTTPSDTQPVSASSLPLPSGAATSAKQLPDNHQVTVSNQIAGFATESTLTSLNGKVSDQSGTWAYDSGVSGSVSIGAGKRVLQISATAGASGATMTINGGSSITIPARASLTIEPKGNLTAPSLVFTSTTAYFVESVS